LAHHQTSGSFIETPVFKDQGSSIADASLASTHRLQGHSSLNGTLVAHYRVFEEIGVGGKGIVYKAEDIKRRWKRPSLACIVSVPKSSAREMRSMRS
jgi:hypothetical protein